MKLSLRDFFVKAWIVYIFFVVISTEILSVFNSINSISVLISHTIFVVGILLWLIKKRVVIIVPKLKIHPFFQTIIIFLSILTIVIPLAFIAIYYPPNNWDSMTYHMSRVMHWIQNQNIAFYPTNNERQLYLGPTSEYIILNWILIFDVDALSNFVQYFSMIGSVIASTLIAKLFSMDKLNQLIAGILTLTIPMGIMQSTTTQNDYLTAFFLISFIYFGLLMVKKKSTTELKLDFIFLAISFALGAFTKNTFLIFSFPFCVYFLYQLFKTYKFSIAKYVFALLTLCLMVNLPQWIRNMEHFGTPIGPAQTIQVLGNDSINLNNTVSNLIRNSAMNLGFPNDHYNNFVDNSGSKLQKIFGIIPNDPRNSFLSIKYKTLSLIHEDVAGNFLILTLLIIVCFVVFLKEKSMFLKLYLSCILGGWLLFSMILKWQPWNTRLQLPLFVISTPIMALVVKKYVKKT